MNSNLLISHMLWDDHQTDYFVVTSLCPIISRQPSSGDHCFPVCAPMVVNSVYSSTIDLEKVHAQYERPGDVRDDDDDGQCVKIGVIHSKLEHSHNV